VHDKRSSNSRRLGRRDLLAGMGVAAGVPLLVNAVQAQTARETPELQAYELPGKYSRQPIRVELSPKWIRVVFGGEVIANSRKVLLVWDRGRTPVYYFPEKDVRMNFMMATSHSTYSDTKGDASYYTLKVGGKVAENAAFRYSKPETSDRSLGPAPDLRGYVAFEWRKMDTWYEEGEEVFVHPHDPYHRIDILQSSRHVRVVLGGITVADSSRPVLLFETGFPARYYLPKADVRAELLRPSDTLSRCAYKGEAQYYSIAAGGQIFKDVIWYYRFPTADHGKIANHLAFYEERVEAFFIDGEQAPKLERARG
jgi:uncharacterized protein (DUF427 family)